MIYHKESNLLLRTNAKVVPPVYMQIQTGIFGINTKAAGMSSISPGAVCIVSGAYTFFLTYWQNS